MITVMIADVSFAWQVFRSQPRSAVVSNGLLEMKMSRHQAEKLLDGSARS